jgi:hypothetical protein
MAKQDDYTRITLRIPAALHAKLTDICDKTNRSMNAEIIDRLNDSLSDPIPRKSKQEVADAGIRIGTAIMGAVMQIAVNRAFSAAQQGEPQESVLRDIERRLRVEEGDGDFSFYLQEDGETEGNPNS